MKELTKVKHDKLSNITLYSNTFSPYSHKSLTLIVIKCFEKKSGLNSAFSKTQAMFCLSLICLFIQFTVCGGCWPEVFLVTFYVSCLAKFSSAYS